MLPCILSGELVSPDYSEDCAQSLQNRVNSAMTVHQITSFRLLYSADRQESSHALT